MNVDLKDVGITLVVGAYMLYGTELIVWWASHRNLFRALRKRGIVSETGSVAISLALSFAIGMIMESSTAFVFRDASSPFRAFDGFLLNQVARRAQGPSLPEGVTRILTPLGGELAAVGVLSRVGGPSVVGATENWCADGVSPGDAGKFYSAVVRTYYQAKNTVFDDAERQSELLAIQQRMTFVSAFVLCSVMLALVALPAGAVRCWRLKSNNSASAGRSSIRRIVLETVAGLATLALLATLSWFSYRTEAGEYVRRVLGYYSSDIIERRMQRSDTTALYAIPACRL